MATMKNSTHCLSHSNKLPNNSQQFKEFCTPRFRDVLGAGETSFGTAIELQFGEAITDNDVDHCGSNQETTKLGHVSKKHRNCAKEQSSHGRSCSDNFEFGKSTRLDTCSSCTKTMLPSLDVESPGQLSFDSESPCQNEMDEGDDDIASLGCKCGTSCMRAHSDRASYLDLSRTDMLAITDAVSRDKSTQLYKEGHDIVEAARERVMQYFDTLNVHAPLSKKCMNV